jgi:transposase-like protein
MDTKQIVLKQDRLGRVQRTAEQRAVIVEEFKRSGLSVSRFAQLSGIGYNTLWTWLHQAGIKLRKSRSKVPRLVQAVVSSSCLSTFAGTNSLRIGLGPGVVVELSNVAQVPLAAELIKALNTSKPC